MREPLRSVRAKGGAGWLTSLAASKGRGAVSTTAAATARKAPFILLRFLGTVPFGNPVGAEVVPDVQRLRLGETHLMQQLPGGRDVRAFVPRAASAVDHDLLRAGQIG